MSYLDDHHHPRHPNKRLKEVILMGLFTDALDPKYKTAEFLAGYEDSIQRERQEGDRTNRLVLAAAEALYALAEALTNWVEDGLPESAPDEAECSRCGEVYAGTAEATMEHHRACTGETPENPMGDPLDENDHRDRIDKDGDRWEYDPADCTWHCGVEDLYGIEALDEIDNLYGPLTFALEPQDAAGMHATQTQERP